MSANHCEGAIEDMQEQVEELAEAVVGHRIVSVETVSRPGRYWGTDTVTEITLDNGRRVQLRENGDCCAYTDLTNFLLNADSIDHIITSVTADEEYEKWFVLADMVQVLQLDVDWSEGNYPYYGFGFSIDVVDPEPEPEADAEDEVAA